MLIKHQIRKKKGKLLAIGVAMGLMSCTITGCSAIIQQEEVVLDIPEYKESDLPDGVFLKVDDTFYAPYNEGKTYGQTAMNSSGGRRKAYPDIQKRISDRIQKQIGTAGSVQPGRI